jgi:hypothetical protein
VNETLQQAKEAYFSEKVASCAGDQKKLFKVVNSLLQRNGKSPLPMLGSDKETSEEFSKFFNSKIDKIRTIITQGSTTAAHDEQVTFQHTKELNSWPLTSMDEVLKIVKDSPAKHCSLDPIPSWLFSDAVHECLPFIVDLFNTSLTNGECPMDFKHTVVTPLLKKETLDHNVFNNYRPVSNLPYISKILEKVVAARIKDHLQSCDLLESLQSAYRQHHSTETALVKVFNDLALALDEKKVGILVLLDLSAAFDTIDQDILLKRCSNVFGITGSALSWIKSYMTGRTQSVNIKGVHSDPQVLKCGMPQGSVLGPLLFTMYTTPLGALLRACDSSFHLYPDDTQLYLVFEINQVGDACHLMEDTIDLGSKSLDEPEHAQT